jgi:hypothetical protein
MRIVFHLLIDELTVASDVFFLDLQAGGHTKVMLNRVNALNSLMRLYFVHRLERTRFSIWHLVVPPPLLKQRLLRLSVPRAREYTQPNRSHAKWSPIY